jgi:hypothetical protein
VSIANSRFSELSKDVLVVMLRRPSFNFDLTLALRCD